MNSNFLFFFLLVFNISFAQSKSAISPDTLFFEGPAESSYDIKGSGNLKAGFGIADITPDWPVLLPYGLQEPTMEYFDRTKVKVILLQVQSVEVAWLVFDMIGLDAKLSHVIKQSKISIFLFRNLPILLT